jgi:hypothetical protein
MGQISLGDIVINLVANFASYFSGLDKATYNTKRATKEIQNAFKEAKTSVTDSLSEVANSFGPFGNALSGLTSKATSVFEAFGSGGNAMAGAVLGIGAVGAAAVGAAVGLAELAKQGAEVVERFSLISQKTGINTRDLQVFEAAGKSVGLSLEDMVTGMRKLDQAIAGIGKNAGAHEQLKSLGVTATTNKEALLQLADAFKEMQDGPEKAALAVQFFGKQGLNMIPFLNKGSEGVREYMDLVDRFGPKISKDMVGALEKYKMATVQADLEWQNFKVTIEEKVLPALTKLMSIDWGEKMAGFKGALLGGPAGAVKAIAELNVARAVAADQSKKEAATSEAAQVAEQNRLDTAFKRFEVIKDGGQAAYNLDAKREELAAAIANHNGELAEKIFAQIPALEQAAQLEAYRNQQAVILKRNLEEIEQTHGLVRPKLQAQSAPAGTSPFAPFDPAVLDQKKLQDILDKAPNIGDSPFGKSMADFPNFLEKVTTSAQEKLQIFYSNWKGTAEETVSEINKQYDTQFQLFNGYFHLGEISQEQFNDVSLKLEAERQAGLKRLRQESGTSTFSDAFGDMFKNIEMSGKDFSRSLAMDIGGTLESLNQQLSQFIATGKGLNLKEIGQGFLTNMTSSILKKGESMLANPLMNLFGLGGSKPDGSTAQNALWVQWSGGTLGATAGGGSLIPQLAGVPNVVGGSNFNMNDMLGKVNGGIGGFFNSFASIFGGFFAEGGNVTPGRAYMVGERGRELFMPKAAGTIIPNHALATGGNVNNTTVHVHVNGVTDFDSFKKSSGQISSQMAASISRGQMRNGR